jgi:hypothetical protein
MVHFPGFAHTRLCIQRAVIWFYQIGFPHSEILGSMLACSSPRLIAACHVLHRLLAPRHPPYALSSLTIKLTHSVPIHFESGPGRKLTKGLASLSSTSFKVLCAPLPNCSSGSTHISQGASSPFHIALLSSKTCGFPRHANLEIRVTRCQLLSVVKDLRSVPCFRSERLRTRRSAVAIWSRPCDRTSPKIKNPASSAGHVRPFALGCLYSRSLPNGYARSSIFVYPVCVTNLTSA